MPELLMIQDFLPAILAAAPMTDDEFATLSDEHSDRSIETTAKGELVVAPAGFTLTGARNSEISFQLHGWSRQDGRGVAFDSSTGFVLPDGSRRSPDAAWVSADRIPPLDSAAFGRYWRLCPDFVIELKSQSDRSATLRDKMAEWIANGAKLGWLVDPETRSVEIFRPGAEPEVMTDPPSIRGEGPVSGFTLDLASVWNPVPYFIQP